MNLNVDVEKIMIAKLDQMSSNKLELICTPQKPLLESIMEDISLSRQRSQQPSQEQRPDERFKANIANRGGISNQGETLFGQDPFSNPTGNLFMTPPKKVNGTPSVAASKNLQQNAQLSSSALQSTAAGTVVASNMATNICAMSAGKKVGQFQPYAARKAISNLSNASRTFDAAAMLKSVQQAPN